VTLHGKTYNFEPWTLAYAGTDPTAKPRTPVHAMPSQALPDSFQEHREQVRRKHNKEFWIEKEKSLQELSLQTYSTKHYRSIDSIEIVLKIDNQEDLYHRVIVADSRGLPIKYNTLKPYSSEEIHQFVNTKYQD
jgi:hypothetical protein